MSFGKRAGILRQKLILRKNPLPYFCLYKMIEEYAENNKDINKNQMKRLGFSLDWTRYHYSLEPKIIETVFDTFRKLYEDGLVYRAERLVNYCTKCGTAFSDLEINYIERQ